MAQFLFHLGPDDCFWRLFLRRTRGRTGREVALHVVPGENAMLSDEQIVEGKRPDLDADEALHFVTELEKHFADLPLQALGQDDLEGARSDPVNVLHPGETFLDAD